MNSEYGLRNEGKTGSRLRWWYLAIVVLLGLACLSWSTQKVASALGWHAALGDPLFRLGVYPVYAPWGILVWQTRFSASPAMALAVHDYGTPALLVWLVPQVLILLFGMQRKPKGKADLHGSAHWATDKEIEATGLLQGKGVFVGSVVRKGIPVALRHNGPEHVLAFAPTRSGKGIGIILPTLLEGLLERLLEGHLGKSLFCLDIKGENYALTSGFLASIGYRIMRLELTDYSGTAAKFNPFLEIRLGEPEAIMDAQSAASILIDPDGKGLNNYWDQASFSFMAGAILHCMLMTLHVEQRMASLTDLSILLASPDRDIQDVYNEMVETDYATIIGQLFPRLPEKYCIAMRFFIASSGREMLNKADNEKSGVLGSALVRLSLYRDPVVAENISLSDFRIRDLVDGDAPLALYIVVSPAHIDRLRPLIRLIINLVIHRLTEKMEFREGKTLKRKHQLLLMLDELPALGNIAILERALPYMAGFGLIAFLIVQDVEQLNAAYGPHNSIMANCHIRIAYAPNNIPTAELLSKMLGTTTVVETKTSLSGSRSGHMRNASVNISETARPLLTPDECSRLPGLQKDSQGRVTGGGNMLIFVTGHAPIYGQQILYFKVPELLKRSLMPPVAESPAYEEAKQKGEAFVPESPVPASDSVIAGEEELQDYEDYL